MQQLLIGIVIAAIIVFLWVRHTREARRKWVDKLHLPGTWEPDSSVSTNPPVLLSLTGQSDRGDYELRFSDRVERGIWVIVRSNLVLTNEQGQDHSYEIRFFETGKIGLDGPNINQQVLVKRVENIVPLRR